MSFRFVDLDIRESPHKKFVGRKRTPGLTDQFLICLTIILTAVGIVMLIHNQLALVAILFTMIGLAAVYVTTQTNRNRNLVQATEFENALFTSIMTKGFRFCLIAGKDGAIVYFNPEFLARFPNVKSGANVREWLAQGNASPADSERVLGSIAKDAEQRFPISINDRDGQKLSLLLSVEPIIGRLSGYVLLRANQAEWP